MAIQNVTTTRRVRRALTTDDVELLRADITDIVKRQLATANDVMLGKKKWTNGQVRLFSLLLDRVVPTTRAIESTEEIEEVNIETLTLEELERIVAQQATEPPLIEHEDAKNPND